MSLNGVLRPGHIQLRMLDLDEGVHFYRGRARPAGDGTATKTVACT